MRRAEGETGVAKGEGGRDREIKSKRSEAIKWTSENDRWREAEREQQETSEMRESQESEPQSAGRETVSVSSGQKGGSAGERKREKATEAILCICR